MWFGQTPMLILTDPELIKDTLNRHFDFTKCHNFPITEYIAPGVAGYDGEQWAKHRKILHPAFNFDKLKVPHTRARTHAQKHISSFSYQIQLSLHIFI